MKQRAKIYQNRVEIIILLALVMIGLAFFLTINKDRSNIRTSKASNVSPVLHHQGEVQDLIILSLIERSASSARFKIRVTTRPDFANLPIRIALGTEKLELLLQRVTTPYDCTDTHDYNKDRIGYETQWFNGNLEDYLDTDIEVVLRAADNSLSLATRPLTHSCSIFSDDIGETNTTGEVEPLPYSE